MVAPLRELFAQLLLQGLVERGLKLMDLFGRDGEVQVDFLLVLVGPGGRLAVRNCLEPRCPTEARDCLGDRLANGRANVGLRALLWQPSPW